MFSKIQPPLGLPYENHHDEHDLHSPPHSSDRNRRCGNRSRSGCRVCRQRRAFGRYFDGRYRCLAARLAASKLPSRHLGQRLLVLRRPAFYAARIPGLLAFTLRTASAARKTGCTATSGKTRRTSSRTRSVRRSRSRISGSWARPRSRQRPCLPKSRPRHEHESRSGLSESGQRSGAALIRFTLRPACIRHCGISLCLRYLLPRQPFFDVCQTT